MHCPNCDFSETSKLKRVLRYYTWVKCSNCGVKVRNEKGERWIFGIIGIIVSVLSVILIFPLWFIFLKYGVFAVILTLIIICASIPTRFGPLEIKEKS